MKPEAPLRETGSSEDLRDELRKERRLLIVVSLVFLAHLLFGLTVGRSAETLGFKFEVRDPEDIWKFVGAIWLWALLRYGLYFHDYTDEDMDIDLKRRQFRVHEWVAVRRIRRTQASEGLLGRKPNRHGIIQVDLGIVPTSGFNGRIHYDSATARVTTTDDAGGVETGGFAAPQVFGPIEARLIRYGAWVHLMVTTRYGTEYIVPFILGLSPAMLIAWRHLLH